MSGGGGVCRYFLKGSCKFGNNCKFSHPGYGGGGGTRPRPRGADQWNQSRPHGGGREVCQYFLQGRCKFGESCRSLHTGGERGGRGYERGQGGYHHQPDPRVETGRSWDQRGGNRYSLLSDDSSTQRYQDNQRSGGFSSHDSRSGLHDSRYSSHDSRYSSHDSRPSYHDSRFSSSGFRSSGNPFAEVRGGTRDYGGNGIGAQSGSVSTPSDPTSARDVVAMIKEDMAEWRSSSMWPFSCYAYGRGKNCLPGFSEMAPEELRWEAYKANVAGNVDSFIQLMRSLEETQMRVWNEYSSITVDDAAKLVSESSPHSLFGSQSTQSNSFFAASGPGPSSIFGSSGTTESLFGAKQTSTSLFSDSTSNSLFGGTVGKPLFGSNTGTQQQTTDGLIQQQQQQQQQQGATVFQTSAQSTNTQLTADELEAFKADKFSLGHIPERPPPPVLC